MAAVGSSVESLLKVETGLLEPRLCRLEPAHNLLRFCLFWPLCQLLLSSLPSKLLFTSQNPTLSVTACLRA